MTHDEMIAVIKAHKDGNKIQSTPLSVHSLWGDDDSPMWNFALMDYRVKPEPLERWLFIPTYGREEVICETQVMTSDGAIFHMREVEDE